MLCLSNNNKSCILTFHDSSRRGREYVLNNKAIDTFSTFQKGVFMKLNHLIFSALCASIIVILSQITIPLGTIPITGQTLAIGIVATILGAKFGTISVCIYILLGIIGLPVFAGFSSGIGILLGPTGGFIIGFIPAAYITGLYIERMGTNYFNGVIANVLGACIILLIGMIQLKYILGVTWTTAFITGVVPFIFVGILKAVLAAWIGVKIRQQLLKNRLLAN